MNNFKEFLEILKLPPSILSALMIVSGLILMKKGVIFMIF